MYRDSALVAHCVGNLGSRGSSRGFAEDRRLKEACLKLPESKVHPMVPWYSWVLQLNPSILPPFGSILMCLDLLEITLIKGEPWGSSLEGGSWGTHEV